MYQDVQRTTANNAHTMNAHALMNALGTSLTTMRRGKNLDVAPNHADLETATCAYQKTSAVKVAYGTKTADLGMRKPKKTRASAVASARKMNAIRASNHCTVTKLSNYALKMDVNGFHLNLGRGGKDMYVGLSAAQMIAAAALARASAREVDAHGGKTMSHAPNIAPTKTAMFAGLRMNAVTMGVHGKVRTATVKSGFGFDFFIWGGGSFFYLHRTKLMG